MLDIKELPRLFNTFRARWSERDSRMLIMTAMVDGSSLITTTPDDEDQPNNSPNLIQVGIEDTAESAALMPSLRVQPAGVKASDREIASKMEQIATSYVDRAGGHLFLVKCFMDLVGYGFFCLTESIDFETKLPRLDHRDVVGCYPEPGWRSGDSIRRCLFARSVWRNQLPIEYQRKMALYEYESDRDFSQQQEVVLVEWYDEDQIVVAALYSSNFGNLTGNGGEWEPVELERFEHGYKLCPVQIGQRVSLDHEPRGQFDQVVEPLLAHARLFRMAIDFADQAVYSDMWVKDPIGPVPWGGGGMIQLGANGGIGRVQPAVSSLSLFQELDRLTDAVHLGGRWPKSRPGEIDQSIASAKFLESSVGMMNTAIRTYHEIMADTLGMAVRSCLKIDRMHGKKSATAQGVLRNQRFAIEYDPKQDIDLSAKVQVEYGLGLGKDPAQSAVMHIQYAQAGFISQETVQESIDGITDVERERRRIDVEKLTLMLMAKLQQAVEAGSIPDEVLFNMLESRNKGEDMVSLLKKYMIKPQQDAAASGIVSGLGGGLQQPGGPPAPPGGAGPTPPPPPPAPSMIAQMSTPAGGPGNFMGSRVQTGG